MMSDTSMLCGMLFDRIRALLPPPLHHLSDLPHGDDHSRATNAYMCISDEEENSDTSHADMELQHAQHA